MEKLIELIGLIIKQRYDEVTQDEVIDYMDSISVQELMFMEEGVVRLFEMYKTLASVKQMWKELG